MLPHNKLPDLLDIFSHAMLRIGFDSSEEDPDDLSLKEYLEVLNDTDDVK